MKFLEWQSPAYQWCESLTSVAEGHFQQGIGDFMRDNSSFGNITLQDDRPVNRGMERVVWKVRRLRPGLRLSDLEEGGQTDDIGNTGGQSDALTSNRRWEYFLSGKAVHSLVSRPQAASEHLHRWKILSVVGQMILQWLTTTKIKLHNWAGFDYLLRSFSSDQRGVLYFGQLPIQLPPSHEKVSNSTWKSLLSLYTCKATAQDTVVLFLNRRKVSPSKRPLQWSLHSNNQKTCSESNKSFILCWTLGAVYARRLFYIHHFSYGLCGLY